MIKYVIFHDNIVHAKLNSICFFHETAQMFYTAVSAMLHPVVHVFTDKNVGLTF